MSDFLSCDVNSSMPRPLSCVLQHNYKPISSFYSLEYFYKKMLLVYYLLPVEQFIWKDKINAWFFPFFFFPKTSFQNNKSIPYHLSKITNYFLNSELKDLNVFDEVYSSN